MQRAVFKYLRLLLLLVCGMAAGYAFAADDSLILLRGRCATLTDNADHRQALRVASKLRREARTRGDRLNEAYGLYYEGVSDILLGNADNGKEKLDQALLLAREVENDTILHYIYNAMGIY